MSSRILTSSGWSKFGYRKWSKFGCFFQTPAARPSHIVCAYDEEDHMAIVITVYEPDPDLWIEFRRRKK